MRCPLRIILLCLLVAICCVHHAQAATPVNIQTCTTTPTTGGLIGCPTANVVFAAVAPSTLVRSQVAGAQGWRAFSTLTPADSVVSATDGGWHPLSSLTVATLTPPVTPPVVTPPVTVPATQSVTITSADNPQLTVTFMGVPTPGCFTVNAKQVCVP